jgi:uncharacterized protein (DUF169 family)
MENKILSQKLEELLGLDSSPIAVKIVKTERALTEYKRASSKKPLLPTFNVSQKRTNFNVKCRKNTRTVSRRKAPSTLLNLG